MRAVSCIAASVMIAILWTANNPHARNQTIRQSSRRPRRRRASKQEAKPDKNQYWLLYPTPPDQMRSFSTDRPTKSNVPYTVDAGHSQYETDLVNVTHQVTGSTHTDT